MHPLGTVQPIIMQEDHQRIIMGCTVPNGCIHTFNSPNYCDYNATHSYANSSRLKNRRYDLTIKYCSKVCYLPLMQPYLRPCRFL